MIQTILFLLVIVLIICVIIFYKNLKVLMKRTERLEEGKSQSLHQWASRRFRKMTQRLDELEENKK